MTIPRMPIVWPCPHAECDFWMSHSHGVSLLQMSAGVPETTIREGGRTYEQGGHSILCNFFWYAFLSALAEPIVEAKTDGSFCSRLGIEKSVFLASQGSLPRRCFAIRTAGGSSNGFVPGFAVPPVMQSMSHLRSSCSHASSISLCLRAFLAALALELKHHISFSVSVEVNGTVYREVNLIRNSHNASVQPLSGSFLSVRDLLFLRVAVTFDDEGCLLFIVKRVGSPSQRGHTRSSAKLMRNSLTQRLAYTIVLRPRCLTQLCDFTSL